MIIFTMAGQSRRFIDAGYRRPKWMLPVSGKPMFEWAVQSFAAFFETEQFVFAYRDDGDSRRFIEKSLGGIGLSSASLVNIEQPTRGQAETLALALTELSVGENEPLLVFNIDTLIPNFLLPDRALLGDGWLQCVEAPGDNWSFVSPQNLDSRRVARVVEKVRISNLCSTGAYFFREASLFMEAFHAEIKNPPEGELYIAPLYNRLIANSREVNFDLIRMGEVFFCGTPTEYENCLSRQTEIVRAYYF